MGLGRVECDPSPLPFTGTLMNSLRIHDEAVATPENLKR